MDHQTKAATTTSNRGDQECRECGWPFGPDLDRIWLLGRRVTICKNPWACYGRRLDLQSETTAGPA